MLRIHSLRNPLGRRTAAALPAWVALLVVCGAAWTSPAGVGGPAGRRIAAGAWLIEDMNRGHLQSVIPRAAEAGMDRVQLDLAAARSAAPTSTPTLAADLRDTLREAIDLARQSRLAVDLVLPVGSAADFDERDLALLAELPVTDGLVLAPLGPDRGDWTGWTGKLHDSLRTISPPGPATDQAPAPTRPRALFLRRPAAVPYPLPVEAWSDPALQIHGVEPGPSPGHPLAALPNAHRGPIQLDLSQERLGRNRILCARVAELRETMASIHGTAIARIEAGRDHTLGTPNEVVIEAFSRWCTDPDIPADGIWLGWAARRYGAAAAGEIVSIMKRSGRIARMIYFPLGHALTRGSNLPEWQQAVDSLDRDNPHLTMHWVHTAAERARLVRMRDPDEDLLVEIAHEKALARLLNDDSLADLERARPHLTEPDYRELRGYLELARDLIDVYDRHARALFLSIRCLHLAGASANNDLALARLRARIDAHTRELEELAYTLEQRYRPDALPLEPAAIGRFIRSLNDRLDRACQARPAPPTRPEAASPATTETQ